MTTINDISDLVKIIQEQPQWAETLRGVLLSRELLELPEKFAAFVATVDRQFEAVYQRFEAVDRRFEAVDRQFEAVHGRLDRMDEELRAMNRRMNQMNGRLDNALGRSYEYKIEKDIRSIAEDQLNIERARIWKGPNTGFLDAPMDILEQARTDGIITPDEYREMFRVDIILRGMGLDHNPESYATIETSITIGGSDIIRVSRRAEILGRALDHPVIAAVVGTQIDDERSQLAQDHNVRVALMPQ